MKERMEALWQLQDVENVTAETSSAVHPQLVSGQETQDLFARLNVGVEHGETAQQDSFFMPSTELRRNVTRRRFNERARESVGSTSVLVQRLVSRKAKEALEEDIDEALVKQNQDDFHHLVQQHKQVNQDMYDVLVGSPLDTSTPA